MSRTYFERGSRHSTTYLLRGWTDIQILEPAARPQCSRARSSPCTRRQTVSVTEEHNAATSVFSATGYFASQASGVKSSLCFVLKIMFLVLISRMDGGCRGVAIANRASWEGIFPPFSCRWFWPCRNLSRPWMFKACNNQKVIKISAKKTKTKHQTSFKPC